MQDYSEDEENGEQWRCRVDHGGMREGSAEGQGVEAKSCDDQTLNLLDAALSALTSWNRDYW